MQTFGGIADLIDFKKGNGQMMHSFRMLEDSQGEEAGRQAETGFNQGTQTGRNG